VSDSSFLKELQKRKVLQSAAIYGAIAWGVTEVLVTIVEQLYLPPWISTLAVIFFVVGFPVAMFLAWTFDFTTEGIHRTSVTSRRGAASMPVFPHQTWYPGKDNCCGFDISTHPAEQLGGAPVRQRRSARRGCLSS
jgi:hypothetical protein